jgi:hypothetical protein
MLYFSFTNNYTSFTITRHFACFTEARDYRRTLLYLFVILFQSVQRDLLMLAFSGFIVSFLRFRKIFYSVQNSFLDLEFTSNNTDRRRSHREYWPFCSLSIPSYIQRIGENSLDNISVSFFSKNNRALSHP